MKFTLVTLLRQLVRTEVPVKRILSALALVIKARIVAHVPGGGRAAANQLAHHCSVLLQAPYKSKPLRTKQAAALVIRTLTGHWIVQLDRGTIANLVKAIEFRQSHGQDNFFDFGLLDLLGDALQNITEAQRCHIIPELDPG